MVTKSPSIGNGEATTEKNENDNHLQIRPRSSSYGGGKRYQRHKGVHADRTPFADYTLFPDKDPKCATNIPEIKTEKVIECFKDTFFVFARQLNAKLTFKLLSCKFKC